MRGYPMRKKINQILHAVMIAILSVMQVLPISNFAFADSNPNNLTNPVTTLGPGPTVPVTTTSNSTTTTNTNSLASNTSTDFLSNNNPLSIASPAVTTPAVPGAYSGSTVEDRAGNDYVITRANGVKLTPANEVASVKVPVIYNYTQSITIEDKIDIGPNYHIFNYTTHQFDDHFVTLQSGQTAILSDGLSYSSSLSRNREPKETIPNFVMINDVFVPLTVTSKGFSPTNTEQFEVSFVVPQLKKDGTDRIVFLSDYNDKTVLKTEYVINSDAKTWLQVPLGWTPAVSNPNYAFSETVQPVGAYLQHTLKLRDLRTGQEQSLTTVTPPFYGSLSTVRDVSPETTPGGPVVIYQVSGAVTLGPTAYTTNIQRVGNPTAKVSINSTDGILQPPVFSADGTQATVKIQTQFVDGTKIEDKYSVQLSSGINVGSPVAKILNSGSGLKTHSDFKIVTLAVGALNRPYEVFVYDNSQDNDQMRLITKVLVHPGNGLNGAYTLMEIHDTVLTTEHPVGRRILSIGLTGTVAGYPYNTTQLVDIGTGQKLVLSGSPTQVTYNQNLATYMTTDEDLSGNKITRQIVVNLDTLQQVSSTVITVTVIPAPSNANYHFVSMSNGTQTQIYLKDKKTGKSVLIATATAGQTIGPMDVNPEGTYALVNIQRKDPLAPAGTTPRSLETGEVLIFDIAQKKIAQADNINPATGQSLGLTTAQGKVGSDGYRFVNGIVLFNATTRDTFTGMISYSANVINLNISVPRYTKTTFTAITIGSEVFTPQQDKLLFGGQWHGIGNNAIGIYDMATGKFSYQTLPNYGFGGIKAVSSDGATAIVASSVNTIYIVSVRNLTQATQTINIPIPAGQSPFAYSLAQAKVLTLTTVELTLANGQKIYLSTSPLLLNPNPIPAENTPERAVWDYYGGNIPDKTKITYKNIYDAAGNLVSVEATLEFDKTIPEKGAVDGITYALQAKTQVLKIQVAGGKYSISEALEYDSQKALINRKVFSPAGKITLEEIYLYDAGHRFGIRYQRVYDEAGVAKLKPGVYFTYEHGIYKFSSGPVPYWVYLYFKLGGLSFRL